MSINWFIYLVSYFPLGQHLLGSLDWYKKKTQVLFHVYQTHFQAKVFDVEL